MQNVTQETLKNIPLVNPPTQTMKKFNLLVDSMISEIQKNLLENNQLAKLRDFLLPLLMNGQVELKKKEYNDTQN